MAALMGDSQSGDGVFGQSDTGSGVHGYSKQQAGVFGNSTGGEGVLGLSDAHAGVHGHSDPGVGVQGDSVSGEGVLGLSDSAAGVHGYSKNGAGVFGNSTGGEGVLGLSDAHAGVHGHSDPAVGVQGDSMSGDGVLGLSDTAVGVHGYSKSGIGILGQGPLAGRFEGDVEVTGDVRLLNADCAENFTVAEAEGVAPGTVMVLGPEGILRQSCQAYDRRVAGVISGAGDYRPGIVLDSHGTEPDRLPVALMGKVFCKVDAQFGSIEIGDLLTTSPTPGHAMRAADPLQAFGAVIGKALRPLESGQGLIPVLVALQ